MADLLTVRDLKVSIAVDAGVIKAVDGVSFRVPEGGTVALVGESGSGKSVVAQSIMGILPRIARIDSGEIIFRDPRLPPAAPGTELDLSRLNPAGRKMRHIRGGRISIIFQEPMTALSPLHTIGNQIGESLALHRTDLGRSERRAAVIEMLRLAGFADPAKAEHTYPFELSGGLRQRAMISMALVSRPALLIADEPTTALDVTIQAQILQLIQQLQGELGMAVLLITHDLGVVANMAEEVVVMYRGRVTESGAIGDIFSAPRHPYLKALMRAVPRFDMRPGERLTPIRDIQVTGEHLITSGSGRFKAYGGALLEVRNLSKRYAIRKRSFLGRKNAGELLAVDDLSLSVGSGECLGLVGESGCGKTTTAKMILRSLAPDAGAVLFHGEDVLAKRGAELFAYRRKVQFVFQDPWSSLDPRMTVGAIVGEGLVVHGLARGKELLERVARLLATVGLPPDAAARRPDEFSGGQRQRIGIARALAVEPDFIVCDEAVAALDVSVQAQVLNLLVELRERHGIAYLFISHDLAIVRHVSRRVAVMYLGEIVETGSAEQVLRGARHPYTQALLRAVPAARPGEARARIVLAGEPPSPIAPPSGCRFHPRCPFAQPECRAAKPAEREVEPGHFVSCIL